MISKRVNHADDLSPDAPPILYDQDGAPMAVRMWIARTAKMAVRAILEEHPEWCEHVPCREIDEDGEIVRPILSEYRALVESCKITNFSVAGEGDDISGSEYGEDTWFDRGQTGGGIPYWRVEL